MIASFINSVIRLLSQFFWLTVLPFLIGFPLAPFLKFAIFLRIFIRSLPALNFFESLTSAAELLQ
jgi:hypothetical protein